MTMIPRFDVCQVSLLGKLQTIDSNKKVLHSTQIGLEMTARFYIRCIYQFNKHDMLFLKANFRTGSSCR